MSNSVFPLSPIPNLTVGQLMDVLKDVPQDANIKFVDFPESQRLKLLHNIYLSYDLFPSYSNLDDALQTKFLTFVLH